MGKRMRRHLPEGYVVRGVVAWAKRALPWMRLRMVWRLPDGQLTYEGKTETAVVRGSVPSHAFRHRKKGSR